MFLLYELFFIVCIMENLFVDLKFLIYIFIEEFYFKVN